MVSSRSKTAAEAAANKRTTRSAVAAGISPQVPDVSITELDTKATGRKASGAAAKKSVSKTASSKSPISSTSSSAKSTVKSKNGGGGGAYCICNGEDDGSPMIKCEGECQNWYHFECISLDEDVAGEIEKYYCPECETKTGLKTVMDFEGPDAFVAPPSAPSTVARKARSKTPLQVEEVDVVDTPEESEGVGSEDDYVAEPTGKRARSGKRIARRLSFSSDKTESGDDDDESDGGRRRHVSRGGRLKRLKKAPVSPTESSLASKRRGSSAQHPAAKRSKTVESAHDDAIRGYCLTKLEEIVRPMFEEYREAQNGSQTQGQPDAEQSGDSKESTTRNDEEENNALDQKVKSFVNELEHCMMESYAEPDKTGKPSAGGKYKERFRMLQFNLPKKDRVILRRGIASGRITPPQLNVMSSTDLADEQTKHDIEIAEKESLEHSILQKITAPRAKITHKGLETIEDFSGQRAADAAKEEEEQRMRMEKLEREKLARMRSLSLQARSPTTAEHPSPLSATFPKANSPTVANVPHSQQPWAAPLPPSAAQIPQAQHDAAPPASPSTNRPYVRPLFVPSMSTDHGASEESLSLADLINIDGDMPVQDSPQSNPQQRMSARANADVGSSSSPVITTPSGPSPFAPSRPAESASRASFDLTSLWTSPETDKEPDKEAEDKLPDAGGDDVAASESMEEGREDAMELESDSEDDDRALDAILEQGAIKEEAQSTEAPAPQPDSSPEVWAGQITMPRDNFDALAIDVTCKQIAGRTLELMSGYWQTLFPSPQARIDGRVPTAQSIKYLVSIRMNSSKELIVVNFTPRSDEALVQFNELIDFLIGKDRHALVFPWGNQPRPQAPGREFYIVPLLKDHPLPEFIELMDDHRLPRERTENLLLGVFVLNRGKLVAVTPPPGAAGAPAPAPTPYPPVPTPFFQMPGIPPIPSIPSGLPASHSPSPIAPPPPKINQQALAAEVASLTPEQISFMLRHLTQSAPLAASSAVPAATSAPAAPPPAPSPYPPPIPGMPLFPPQFSPSHQQQMQAPPLPQPYSPPRNQGQYGDYHYDERDDWGDGQGRRGSRGRGNDRGRRGFRGRGKPFQDDRNNRPPPADRGWGGRGRGAPPR